MFRLEFNDHDLLLLPPDLSVVIGRAEHCDLQLDDPSVSRVHCRLIATGGKVTLTDVSSRWGTFVNGKQVTECDLRPGDKITIGETVLRLVVESQPGKTTLAPRGLLLRPEGVSIGDQQFALPTNNAFSVSNQADELHGHSESASIGLMPDIVASDFLGRIFHRYQIQQTIAVTSSGIVFRATELQQGNPVALKLFHPSFFADDIAVQRFERAVKTMFGLRHPNIVELYNAGHRESYCFTASQLVEGKSAVELIQRIGIAGMLAPATVLQIAMDLCEALRFAESRNIVHRNISPSNILLAADNQRTPSHAPEANRGRALLNDLILARASKISGAEQLTQAGAVLGEVRYMSPEQLGSGHPVDCRSDIYQLGATLYALLTGRPPFEGGRLSETITQILTVPPTSIRVCHMATPAQFDTLVLKMLQKNPRDRFQTADELSIALQKVASETGQVNLKAFDADPRGTGWGGALDGLL